MAAEQSEDQERDERDFADDLFEYLRSQHPCLRRLPKVSTKPRENNIFSEDVGKSIIYTWHVTRKSLLEKLRCDFPRFVENKEAFKAYLEELCGIVRQTTNNSMSQALEIAAFLFELHSFLYSRGVTNFFNSAKDDWLFMFKLVAKSNFYDEGGFRVLTKLSKRQANDYDNSVDEIYHQYRWGVPVEVETSYNSSRKITNSTDCSSGVLSDDVPPNILTEANKFDSTFEDRKVKTGPSFAKPLISGISKGAISQAAAKSFKSKNSPPKIYKDITLEDKTSKPAQSPMKRNADVFPSRQPRSPKHGTPETQSTSRFGSTEKKKSSPIVTKQTSIIIPKVPAKANRQLSQKIERRFSLPKYFPSDVSKSPKSISSKALKRSTSQDRLPLTASVKITALKQKALLSTTAKVSKLKYKSSSKDPIKTCVTGGVKETSNYITLRGRIKKPPEESTSSNSSSVHDPSVSTGATSVALNVVPSYIISEEINSKKGTISVLKTESKVDENDAENKITDDKIMVTESHAKYITLRGGVKKPVNPVESTSSNPCSVHDPSASAGKTSGTFEVPVKEEISSKKGTISILKPESKIDENGAENKITDKIMITESSSKYITLRGGVKKPVITEESTSSNPSSVHDPSVSTSVALNVIPSYKTLEEISFKKGTISVLKPETKIVENAAGHNTTYVETKETKDSTLLVKPKPAITEPKTTYVKTKQNVGSILPEPKYARIVAGSKTTYVKAMVTERSSSVGCKSKGAFSTTGQKTPSVAEPKTTYVKTKHTVGSTSPEHKHARIVAGSKTTYVKAKVTERSSSVGCKSKGAFSTTGQKSPSVAEPKTTYVKTKHTVGSTSPEPKHARIVAGSKTTYVKAKVTERSSSVGCKSKGASFTTGQEQNYTKNFEMVSRSPRPRWK